MGSWTYFPTRFAGFDYLTKRRLGLIAVFVVCTIGVAVAAGCSPEPTSPLNEPVPSPTLPDMVAEVSPSVVRILTEQGSGSGIVVREDGMVLTANHVVEGVSIGQVGRDRASVEVVTASGEHLEGIVVCRAPEIDLAIVQAIDGKLLPARVGSSSGLQLGDEVVKLGYPLNLPGTASVTTGIISAIRDDEAFGQSLIQTDASLSPGDSGGPLFDRYGFVVGINVITWQQPGVDGVGFAVPIDEAKLTLLKDLESGSDCLISTLVAPGAKTTTRPTLTPTSVAKSVATPKPTVTTRPSPTPTFAPRPVDTPKSTATPRPTHTPRPLTSQVVPPTPTPSPTPKPDSPSVRLLGAFTGQGLQSTETFTVDDSPWRLEWEVSENVDILLMEASTGRQVANLVGGLPSGSTLIYGFTGTFFLRIGGTENAWSMTVKYGS